MDCSPPSSPLSFNGTCYPKSTHELLNLQSLPQEVRNMVTSGYSVIGDKGVQKLPESHKETNSLCRHHKTHSSKLEVSQAVWSLQWNITACLLRRMVEIVESAKDIAKRYREWNDSKVVSVVGDTDVMDLELAFTGDARGGFQWLHCLAKDDDCFVETVGTYDTSESECPACLLGRAVDSETNMRLLLIAARLSGWDFYVSSIKRYLQDDPWYGPGYWESIDPKAVLLEGQIRQLLKQCAEMEQELEEAAGSLKQQATIETNEVADITYETRENTALHSFFFNGADTPTLQQNNSLSEDVKRYCLAFYCWMAILHGDRQMLQKTRSRTV